MKKILKKLYVNIVAYTIVLTICYIALCGIGCLIRNIINIVTSICL